MKLTITVGLSGSGKSTWALEQVNKTGNTVRINRDSLRQMCFDSKFTHKREKSIIAFEKVLAKQAFEDGYNVIIDDTNLSIKTQSMWKNFARECGVAFVTHNINTDLETCIFRDSLREQPVGRPVIERQNLTRENSTFKDIDEIVLVDIDGTIADCSHRLHYLDHENKDWVNFFSKVSLDEPIMNVIDFINDLYIKWALSGHNGVICILTARPSKYVKNDHVIDVGFHTEVWLNEYINYDHLLMRREGDKRPDVDVKKEILSYLPKEKISLVLEDRPRVIDMYKEEGLNVVDVTEYDSCISFDSFLENNKNIKWTDFRNKIFCG